MKPTLTMDHFSNNLRFRKSARSVCVLLALTIAFSPTSPAKKRRVTTPAVEVRYIAALATANRFLTAWQSSDQEAALLLLTDRAKHKASEAGIDALFHGPRGRAFEIVHGRPLNQSRYQFPVVLLQVSGETNQPHRKFTNIVIANSGKNDWAVDTLP